LSGDHFRALGDFSRPGLEIELNFCRIAGAANAELAQILEHNQGPSKLDYCGIDYSVFAVGSRGNSRLKSFSLDLSDDFDVRSQQVLAIASALRENKGLVELNLSGQRFGLKVRDEA
jgi:hypothetical protein